VATTRALEVAGSEGRPVRAVLHGDATAPHILVAHGFKGFKDWGCWAWVCEQLAEAGFCAVRFDYSHNGVETTDFDRLDLFLLDTWTRHQEDLAALAEALPGRLGLLGHSRGGGDALLFAADHPRVAAVVTWASVASTRFEPPGWEEALRTQGFYAVRNGRTGQDMPIGRHAFEDAHRHDLVAAAGRVACPVLLIHGDDDAAVPPTAMDTLARAVPSAATLTIAGAGHTFGARHPWAGPTAQLEQAMGATSAFFLRSAWS